MSKTDNKNSHRERGSIFTALLGAVLLIGVISVATFNILAGPVATMSRNNTQQMANQQIDAVTRVIIDSVVKGASDGDCDADGYIEPTAYTSTNKLPVTLGVPQADPWGTDYLYCPFDVGTVDAAGCGGAGALLTNGSPTPAANNENTRYVIAVASAGPDRIMQTTCSAYVNGTTAIVTPGGDDIVRTYTYAEALAAAPDIWDLSTAGVAQLNNKKLEILAPADSSVKASIDEATGVGQFANVTSTNLINAGGGVELGAPATCNSEGLLRYSAGVVEVCDGSAWQAVSGSGGGGGGGGSGSGSTGESGYDNDDVSTDLIAHWTFDETSGTSATDSSGSGYTVTTINGPTWQGSGGKIGGALQFDGVNDYAYKLESGSTNLDMYATYHYNGPPSSITISAWVYATGPAGRYTIIEKGGNLHSNWRMGFDSGGHLFFKMDDSTHTVDTIYASDAPVYTQNLNTWAHYVATYTLSVEGTMELYVNGARTAGSWGDGNFGWETPDVGDRGILIGAHCNIDTTTNCSGSTVDYFTGKIDDIRVYNRLLTAQQIATLYNTAMGTTVGAGDTTTGLIDRWTFDETGGTTAADSVGSYNGTLRGNAGWSSNARIGTGSLVLFSDGDYVSLAANAFNAMSVGTITAWVKNSNDVYGNQGIFTNGGDATFNGLYINGNSVWWDGGLCLIDPPQACTDIKNLGSWHLVGYAASASGHAFYIDGQRVTASYGLGSAATTGLFGGWNDGAGANYTIGALGPTLDAHIGYIDDVRLYNRALSDADMAALYAEAGGATAPGEDMWKQLPWDVTQYDDGDVLIGTQTHDSSDDYILDIVDDSADTTLMTVPTHGMKGHWAFDETSGTSAADSSGNGNSGTLTNGPTWTTAGRRSGAAVLDGSNDYITMGSPSALDDIDLQGQGGMSIALWMKFNVGTATGVYSLLSKAAETMANNTGYWTLAFSYNSSNATDFVRFVKDYATTDLLREYNTCAAAIDITKWNHIALRWDGANAGSSGTQVYINGVRCAFDGVGGANGSGAKASDAAGAFWVGRGSNSYFPGVIDDVHVFNYLVTEDVIRKLALKPPQIYDDRYTSTFSVDSGIRLENQRGTADAPAVPVWDDNNGGYRFYSRASGAWAYAGEIRGDVCGTPAGGYNYGCIHFLTGASAPTSIPASNTNQTSLYYQGVLVIGGSQTTGYTAGTGTGAERISMVNYYTDDDLWLNSSSSTPEFIFRRSKGTVAAPTALASTNAIGMLGFSGRDTDSFMTTAGLYGVVQATAAPGPVLAVSNAALPTDIRLNARTAAITNTTGKMTVKSNGVVTVGLSAATNAAMALEQGGSGGIMVSPSTSGTPETITSLAMPAGGYMVMHGEKGSFRGGNQTSAWTLNDSDMPDVTFNWGDTNATSTDHTIVIGTSSTVSAKRGIALAHTSTVSAEGGIAMATSCTVNGFGTNTTGDTTTGLVGWWKFDETSGTSAADSSGNSLTGTLTNGPTWTTAGRIGGALTFDGTNDLVSVADNAVLDLSTTGSLSAWVYLNALTLGGGTEASLIHKGQQADYSDIAYSLSTFSGDSIDAWPQGGVFVTSASFDRPRGGIGTTTALQTGKWYHMVTTWSNTANVMNIYLNGLLYMTQTSTKAARNSAGALYIGKNPGDQTINGKIDDVRIYNRQLSAADVQALYNAGFDTTTGLVAHYKLDEGTGSTAADSSGYANTGTVYGNLLWSTPRAGMGGSALYLDGTNDYVEAPNTANNNVSGTGLTLSAWVATDYLASDEDIIIKPWNAANDAANHQYYLRFNSASDQYEFGFADAGGTQYQLAFPHRPDNGWQLVTGTYDGANMKFYIDGVLVKTQAETHSINARGQTLRIGTSGGYIHDFRGGVDDVRVYSRALSAEEVFALAGNHKGAVNGICLGGKNPSVGGFNAIALGGLDNRVNGNYAIALGERMEVGGDYSIGIDLATSTYKTLNRANTLGIFGGNVGIATLTPAHRIAVTGTAGLSTGTAWTNTSDIRLKDIDGDYEYGLDRIMKLHPVRFHYKKDNPLALPSDVAMTGFIAQEVQPVFPEAVTARDDGYLEFNIHPISVAMVNAVKELGTRSDALLAASSDVEAATRQSRMEREKLGRNIKTLKSATQLAALDPALRWLLAFAVPLGVLAGFSLARRRAKGRERR